jgi:hypothetical protein
MIPSTWKNTALRKKAAQVAAIKALLKDATEVVIDTEPAVKAS